MRSDDRLELDVRARSKPDCRYPPRQHCGVVRRHGNPLASAILFLWPTLLAGDVLLLRRPRERRRRRALDALDAGMQSAPMEHVPGLLLPPLHIFL